MSRHTFKAEREREREQRERERDFKMGARAPTCGRYGEEELSFPWAAALRRQAPDIRREALSLLSHAGFR